MKKPAPHSKTLRLFFFWSGIVATLAYRIIAVLNNYSKVWVQIAWYIGTIGFIIYFAHRYQISEKRAHLIKQHNLAGKIVKLDGLNSEEKEAAKYVLGTLVSSKEKWNSIFIFIASAIALAWGIYLDLVKPLLLQK